jgi:hypothetical protein
VTVGAHFEALEADFRAQYGLDLSEVLWGDRRFGVRRIRALIYGLPHDGAFARAVLAEQAAAPPPPPDGAALRGFFGDHLKYSERTT